MRYLLPLLGLLIFLPGCARSTRQLPAVTNFDATRYMGRWYEIARLPNRFERDMDAVTATYSLNENGSVTVVNRGRRDGLWKSAEGRAKFAGPRDLGHLRVSFFGPFYADYKILELDPDYSHALVTSGNYGYLWLLAREPRLPDATRDRLIDHAREIGFDTNQLIHVDQSYYLDGNAE